MAATTFNVMGQTDHVFVVTSGGTVWSANHKAATVFDYFADDCVVDDFIIFTGQTYRKFRNIVLTIGTAFAATSVTFVWEYWDSNSWETLSVTDGTSDFTSTGTVEFLPPADWGNNYNVSGLRRHFPIRCRITAIDTPTEGGANVTTEVKVGNNEILVSDIGVAYTMEKIYDEDVAGGWGVVTKLATKNHNVYKVDADLMLSRCDFTSTNETVIFEQNLRIGQHYSNIAIGEKLTDYTAENGSTWLFHNYTWSTIGGPSFGGYGGNVYIYGSRIVNTGPDEPMSITQHSGKTIELIDSMFQVSGGDFQIKVYDDGTNFAFRNCTVVARQYALSNSDFPADFEDITVTNTNAALRFTYSAAGTVLGLVSRGSPTYNAVYMWNYEGEVNVHNSPDLDLTDNYWLAYGSFNYTTSGGTINEKYSLDLTIIDVNGDAIDGATVVVKDVNGDAITGSPFTADGSGDVSCGFLLRRIAEFGGAAGDGVDSAVTKMTDYDPYTVTVSKAGYASKTIKYTMDKKRDDVILLSPDGSTQIYDSTIYDSTIY